MKKILINNRQNILMFLPSLIGLVAFFIVPMIKTVYYSFTESMVNTTFVGIENYEKLLDNSAFLLAINNTVMFYIIALPLIIFLPFLLAILFNTKILLFRLFNTLTYICIIIPSASLMIFLNILFSSNGLLSEFIFSTMGYQTTNLFSTEFSFILLVILFLFKYGGINYLIYSVVISRIPNNQFEAARLDGASWFHLLKYIIFPYTIPTVIIISVLSILNSYKIYREAFLIGGYYPHDSIYLLQHFINNNFVNMNYTRLCCIATLILVISISLFCLVIYIFKNVKRRYI